MYLFAGIRNFSGIRDNTCIDFCFQACYIYKIVRVRLSENLILANFPLKSHQKFLFS